MSVTIFAMIAKDHERDPSQIRPGRSKPPAGNSWPRDGSPSARSPRAKASYNGKCFFAKRTQNRRRVFANRTQTHSWLFCETNPEPVAAFLPNEPKPVPVICLKFLSISYLRPRTLLCETNPDSVTIILRNEPRPVPVFLFCMNWDNTSGAGAVPGEGMNQCETRSLQESPGTWHVRYQGRLSGGSSRSLRVDRSLDFPTGNSWSGSTEGAMRPVKRRSPRW